MESVVSGPWVDRPVLVTGATGLLGGWVVEELVRRRASVVALVRDEVPNCYFRLQGLERHCTVVRGEVADLALLERVLLEYEIDAVFHLAAQSQVGVAGRGPYGTFEANVRGTYTVMESVRRVGAPRAVIVASSDKAYGEQEQLPYVETAPLAAANPYDASKAAADLIARSYARTYGLPVVVTRCGNLFGGGDLNFARLVPGTIRSLLRGERPIIRSDGTLIRDYLYVSDAAVAYVDAAERASEFPGEAFNFSLERPLSVREVVGLVMDATGVRLEPLVEGQATHELQRQHLSSEKARRLLGWAPTVTLEDGLNATIEWYRSYLGVPRRTVSLARS